MLKNDWANIARATVGEKSYLLRVIKSIIVESYIFGVRVIVECYIFGVRVTVELLRELLRVSYSLKVI